MDTWWYHISSPDRLTSQDVIQINLWDTMNHSLVKKVVLNLRENWLTRMKNASTHVYLRRDILKIHINRKHGTNEFIIYFGRKEDGVYPLPDC